MTVHDDTGGVTAEVLDEVGPKSWWVVKYRNQRRINLAGLTDAERCRLAAEFGIEVEGDTDEQRAAMFFASPAFRSLVRWVREHPKQAMEFSRYQNYIADWYHKALAG